MQRHQAAQEGRNEGGQWRAAELEELRAVKRHGSSELTITPNAWIGGLFSIMRVMTGRNATHTQHPKSKSHPRSAIDPAGRRSWTFGHNTGPERSQFPRGRCTHRSEEHTSELQSPDHLVCRLLLEKKKKKKN